MHATLNFTVILIFFVYARLILTWQAEDMMMQLISRSCVDLEFTKTASIVNDAFTNLPRPEKAAGMLAENSSAMIPPLGQGWLCDQVTTRRNIKRICNLFQAQEVTIQGGVGGPEIAFRL